MHANDLTFRPAVPADAGLLRRWETEPHPAGQLGDGDWQWETSLREPLPGRELLIAEIGGRRIGFVQILDPSLDPERYWGDQPPGLRALDIWIGEPAAIGRGHGTEMIRQALARCFASPGGECGRGGSAR